MFHHAWPEGNWNEVKVSACLACHHFDGASQSEWKAYYGQTNTGSKGFSTHAASSVAAGATSGTSFQWLKSGTENDVLQNSKSVGFDAEKRR